MNSREVGHIKSRERVRELGEVYTQSGEIAAMLDLIPDMFSGIDYRFLEPACGNGNFLVSILERKIAAILDFEHSGTEHWYEFAVLRCLASIYAIDISDENVYEARSRMSALASAAVEESGQKVTVGFHVALESILATNVVLGDSLNDASKIIFIEYEPLRGERFARTPSYFESPEIDLFFVPLEPLPTVHYSELPGEQA